MLAILYLGYEQVSLGDNLVHRIKAMEQWEIGHFWIKHGTFAQTRQEREKKNILRTHHQVSYHHDQQEDKKAQRLPSYFHAVPHGLDPLPTQNSEDDEEWVEEIIHVPPWQIPGRAYLLHVVYVAFPKKLHSYHGKNKDDDCQHKSEVTEGTHRITNDFNERI